MTNTTHPIEHAIVALLLLFEGVCWIINELAGFHSPLTAETVEDPRDTIAIEAPVPEVIDVTFDVSAHTFPEPDWAELSVKELRQAAKGLAKGIHLMKKAQLVELLVTV